MKLTFSELKMNVLLWWRQRQLRSGNRQTRRRAIRGMSHSADPRWLAPLMSALRDESWLVRKEAARVLGEIGDAQSVRPLLTLLGDSFHPAIAATTVRALEKVLSRTLTRTLPEDVKAAASLGDISGFNRECRVGIAWFSSSGNPKEWTADCSRIRKLAEQELIRRGLNT